MRLFIRVSKHGRRVGGCGHATQSRPSTLTHSCARWTKAAAAACDARSRLRRVRHRAARRAQCGTTTGLPAEAFKARVGANGVWSGCGTVARTELVDEMRCAIIALHASFDSSADLRAAVSTSRDRCCAHRQALSACGVLKLDYASVSFQMQQGLSLATCSSDVCCAPCCMAYYRYPAARYITYISCCTVY
jgi:hypothetical protein